MELKKLADKEQIKKLYYLYNEDLYDRTERNNELLKKVIQAEEKLFENLTEEQQEQFKELEELKNEKVGEQNRNTFIYAFTLAVKLIIESIN